jgi:hypothetical protein
MKNNKSVLESKGAERSFSAGLAAQPSTAQQVPPQASQVSAVRTSTSPVALGRRYFFDGNGGGYQGL